MSGSYGIFNYTVDNFCAYLSHQTNTNFTYVRQKKQITYIDNYLKDLSKDENIFYVYENEYIDKNYIEDFSSYYVNCFPTYKKVTSRVHFFKYKGEAKKLNELKDEFSSALNLNQSLISNENYLGFIVIKPIPKTFLSKVCLKSFCDDKNERLERYYILKEYNISLFGIKLKINSVAFKEQDKVLSACATTSLWSFYHAHPNITHTSVPSSSEITKSAYPDSNGYAREFPSNGLSTDMICRSLRKYNLLPEYFQLQKEKKERLQEAIFAYCSSKIPIILGVSVSEEGKADIKGVHAVTVLGYSMEKSSSNLVSHGLNKIYVHDDRYGPFTRMHYDKDIFRVMLDDNSETGANHKEEIYDVDTLIIGLYHKIRIPYTPIKNTCLALTETLKVFAESLSDTNKEEIENFKQLMNDIVWDISIKQNADLKNALLNEKIHEKEEVLTKALPKYMWSAIAIAEGKKSFQLLFDATDIDQGQVFIEYLSYDNGSADIKDILKLYSETKMGYLTSTDILEEKEENYLDGIISYFIKKESSKENLDLTFGHPKIPLQIKPSEIKDNTINNIEKARANFKVDNGFEFETLEDNEQYIWLIDEEGFLCIGVENEEDKNGHPTLTNGMPARIGGEMELVGSIWEINSKSGRYSSKYEDEEKSRYLDNAIKYKFDVIFSGNKFKKKAGF